ncbi:hypothetical protein E7Q14_07645 [Campylobacter coli]|nr:hypothetical protein [Campylobacter coli]
MTAYVHIGTVKTGTTTIQKFLHDNRNILLKQKCYYPFYCSALDSYRFPKICKIDQNKYYYSGHISMSQSERNMHLLKLKNEIVFHDKIILSSECFHELLFTVQEIKDLRCSLLEIGFSKIYIVLYVRDPLDLAVSFYNTELLLNRRIRYCLFEKCNSSVDYAIHVANHKKTIENWGEVFGRENLIVRLFDKDEFYQGDLLKDFIHSIGLEWDDEFIIPERQNETIDLLGIELTKFLNLHLGNVLKADIQKHFTSKDFHLKFQPPKEVVQSYIDYFEESNEWVRQEFFPHKERLFPKKDLSNYKENYELKEMKPEYWDKIAEFIADIVKTKNQNIADKTNIIQNKDKIITDQTTQIKSLQVNIKDSEVKLVQIQTSNNTLSNIIKEKDNIINSNINQIQSKLSFQTKYGTAKIRIQNQLSYKLGQAMIVNSKSFLGYLIMPMALLSIMISHKQEQKIYQEKIKKNPSLKLPPLEDYLDYQEALKEKECFTYKLGQALIQANKTWYKGGYIRLLLEIRKLKREFLYKQGIK